MNRWIKNSNQEYHNGIGVGSSHLATLYSKSPAHYLAQRQNPMPATPAMKLGTLVHKFILEPETVNLVLAPNLNKNTNKYKDWVLENSDKDIVSEDEWASLHGIRESIEKHSGAKEILSGGVAEMSGYATCPLTNVMRRIRPDYRKGDMIYDLKTTQSVAEDEFSRTIFSLNYVAQSAYYVETARIIDGTIYGFAWVAIEPKDPFAIRVYEPSPRVINEGRAMYIRGLEIYALCTERNEWPCYAEQRIVLDLPQWYRSRHT